MKVKILIVFWGILFWCVAGGAQAGQSEPLIDKEKLVDVGECRLYFSWIAGAETAVLFEAGGGMDSSEWKAIATTVARRTGATVIRYDRAGFGQSDLPASPCRMDVEARWLHEGLERLGLEKKLILVGHSYGGWMIRLFASMYPDSVLGMVFVDPFSVEFVDLLGIEYLDQHSMAGKLPFDASHPETLSKYQKALIRMVGEGLGPKTKLMRDTTLPAGIPIRLISSRIPFLPKPEEQEAWWKAHRQIAAGNRNITLVEAKNSRHMVPLTQPDLIVDQIVEVFRLAQK